MGLALEPILCKISDWSKFGNKRFDWMFQVIRRVLTNQRSLFKSRVVVVNVHLNFCLIVPLLRIECTWF